MSCPVIQAQRGTQAYVKNAASPQSCKNPCVSYQSTHQLIQRLTAGSKTGLVQCLKHLLCLTVLLNQYWLAIEHLHVEYAVA